MNDIKSKEFWIGNDIESPDCDIYEIMGVENRPVWDEEPKGLSIHVIEKSAYDKQVIKTGSVWMKYNNLKSKTDILANALENIMKLQNRSPDVIGKLGHTTTYLCARQALEKYYNK